MYNLLLLVVGLIVAPVAGLLCLVRPTWRHRLRDRLGMGWPKPSAARVLWAHAASVGEIEGIAPLVRRWREQNPNSAVVVSALTATGCDMACELLPGVAVRAFPIDFPSVMRRVVGRVRPSLFLFSENEIWPNAIFALSEAGVPVVQVSGRLSPRAAGLLGRFPRFAREVLGRVTGFCVQSEAARERLVALGVDVARVTVTGSLKGDATPPAPVSFLPALVELGRPVIVAGSTHEGEEEILLDAWQRLEGKRERPFGGVLIRSPRDEKQSRFGSELGHHRPFWIIAPRHPERFAPVAALLVRRGVRFLRRTELSADGAIARRALEGVDLLLLDSIGELRGCFSAATVAFLGGSLAPIGGHNLLEPASAGIPVVVGPHLDSVRETAERLQAAGAADVVRDADGLANALARRLAEGRSAPAGAAARAVAAEMTGSLARTWECVSTSVRGGGR